MVLISVLSFLIDELPLALLLRYPVGEELPWPLLDWDNLCLSFIPAGMKLQQI
jgi:hypothetical protein